MATLNRKPDGASLRLNGVQYPLSLEMAEYVEAYIEGQRQLNTLKTQVAQSQDAPSMIQYHSRLDVLFASISQSLIHIPVNPHDLNHKDAEIINTFLAPLRLIPENLSQIYKHTLQMAKLKCAFDYSAQLDKLFTLIEKADHVGPCLNAV